MMDHNVNISISERLRTIMDDLDQISMVLEEDDKAKLAYYVNNAYSDLRLAYLRSKREKV